MTERTALEIADKLDELASIMRNHNVTTLPKLHEYGKKATDMLRSQHAEIEHLREMLAGDHEEPWAENRRLRRYVGNNMLMSDFRNVDEMRAEIERLTALNSALTAKGNAFVIENARQAEKIDQLTAEKFRRFNNEECWIYQRNGENHLGTLTCPVVISPEALLSMQAEISILTAEREELAADQSRLRAQAKRLRDALVGMVEDDDVNGLRFTAAVLENLDCDDATASLAAVRALIDIRPEGSAGEGK